MIGQRARREKIPGRMPSEVVEGDVENKGGWILFLLVYKIGERDGGLGSLMRGPGQQGDKRTRGREQGGAGDGVGAAVARAAGASSAFSHHKLALPSAVAAHVVGHVYEHVHAHAARRPPRFARAAQRDVRGSPQPHPRPVLPHQGGDGGAGASCLCSYAHLILKLLGTKAASRYQKHKKQKAPKQAVKEASKKAKREKVHSLSLSLSLRRIRH
jgi:hypothetical protein